MRSNETPPVITRPYWLDRLDQAWKRAPIVWLSGVRRVGKTTLAREIPGALFLNCDLPSTARRLDDPERFFGSLDAATIIFDEIHQLADPSRLLKIGADEFPQLKILATGSSTLAATQKFRDSLTGRKRTIHLLPVLCRELGAFGVSSIERRLLHGGLPEPLLADRTSPDFFAEWLDSYFARDVQEMFNVIKRFEFLKLVELLLRQSGGQLEVSSLGKHAALSRPTVVSYLEVLQTTHLISLIRPYHAGLRGEITQQSKAYGFDTGFVSFCRGWRALQNENCGLLWEHLVLETLFARAGERGVYYWRDKQKQEIDFVLPKADGSCDAFECKWDAASFSSRNLAAFRAAHPAGRNFVLSPQAGPPFVREMGGMEVVFSNLVDWEAGETEQGADSTS